MPKSFFFTLRQVYLGEEADPAALRRRAARLLGCQPGDILSCSPVRRSRDARRRNQHPRLVYHLRLEMPLAWRDRLRQQTDLDIVIEPSHLPLFPHPGTPRPDPGKPRPLVVGAGPAGLLAALRLAQAGWRPLLIERGDHLEKRRQVTARFWREGSLDPESNPLFGAGGAGLFSDGKLNTRHKDREGIQAVLGELVRAGAPEDILLDAQPHLGSDRLGEVVNNLLNRICDLGGEILFRTRLSRLRGEKGRLLGVEWWGIQGQEEREVSYCILATGHSARDVYSLLAHDHIELEAKPFAMGLRLEIPQAAINASQSRRLGGGVCATFRLALPPLGNQDACYSFCMCPGGMVIACASEPECLAVNGMSLSARAGDWGNAAFLVPVQATDLAPFEPDPLAGLAFQRHWEGKNYQAGLAGGEYAIPASSLADFMAGRAGELPVRRGVSRATAANLRDLLPPRIGDTLAAALPQLISRLRKVDPATAVLYGVETRTSSPLRIRRDTQGASLSLSGLYPAGEGSGYAGGITTSALDGWKAAGHLLLAHSH